ncbi:WD40-repeat-containing domain protein [Favolaschia claudopus]|uniref:WD40-repeat-containing domain protein n=1 Tax=Favolaschia claudopus TaxID=2862362 RepID=A0AAV9ZPP1_9AGAR
MSAVHSTLKEKTYSLKAKLEGHCGAILRLQATDDGRLLASGGTDGTKVWDVGSLRELEAPGWSELRGATTALVCVLRHGAWVPASQGHTVFEQISCNELYKPDDKPAEVTGLAFDAPTNRLAVCHRGGVVQLYTVNKAMAINSVYSFEVKKFVPRAVAFGQMDGDERLVLLFGLTGGHIHKFKGNKGTLVGDAWSVGMNIGDVAIDHKKGVLCMDDPSYGPNLVRLDDCVPLKAFRNQVTKSRRVRNVAFGPDCMTIITGSDNGVVNIFDRRSGKVVEKLRLHSHEWVQTVTAAECGGVSMIFAAKSRDMGTSNEIFVWAKKNKKTRFGTGSFICAVLLFIQLVFVVGVVVVAYEVTRGPRFAFFR